MKFITHWTVPQGTFNAAVARFLESGGAPPPGVQMLGRWHGMNGEGFAISESNDPKAMGLEETELLPVIPRLSPEQRGELDAAFEAAMDPLVGGKGRETYAALFDRIAPRVGRSAERAAP